MIAFHLRATMQKLSKKANFFYLKTGFTLIQDHALENTSPLSYYSPVMNSLIVIVIILTFSEHINFMTKDQIFTYKITIIAK